MTKRDNALFLNSFLRNPRGVGSLMPSGQPLAFAVSQQIDIHREGFVVELGGGTGNITREILKTGLAPSKLVIVERDVRLFALLKERFPGVRVLLGDAMYLTSLLEAQKISPVHTVVSGLPLLSIPANVRAAILSESFDLLPADGTFLQFTYGLGSPVPKQDIKRLSLEAEVVKRVWKNFPPAKVWRYKPQPVAA